MTIDLAFKPPQEDYRALYETALARTKELHRLLVAIVYQNGGALTINEDTLVAIHEDAELEADGYELITGKGSVGIPGLVLRIKKRGEESEGAENTKKGASDQWLKDFNRR